MFATIERYFPLIRTAKDDADIAVLIGSIACDFGFRGGFLYQYAAPGSFGWRFVDTDAGRADWWREYLQGVVNPRNPRLARLLAGAPFVTFDATRYGPDETEALALAIRGDLLESTAIPLGDSGNIVGALGFRGIAPIKPDAEIPLLIVAYTLFARFRELGNEPLPNLGPALTPRESQVIALATDGFTSLEIGERLGISARTANQHFDNVSAKLKTRNRAHTCAEVIRRGLLQ